MVSSGQDTSLTLKPGKLLMATACLSSFPSSLFVCTRSCIYTDKFLRLYRLSNKVIF